MGKATISMAIFNSYFDITRGYIFSTLTRLVLQNGVAIISSYHHWHRRSPSRISFLRVRRFPIPFHIPKWTRKATLQPSGIRVFCKCLVAIWQWLNIFKVGEITKQAHCSSVGIPFLEPNTHFDPNETAVSSEEEWPVLVVFIDNGRVQDQAKTNSTLYRASYNGMDKSDYSDWMGQNLWDLWYPFPNEGMVILLLYHIENHLHPPQKVCPPLQKRHFCRYSSIFEKMKPFWYKRSLFNPFHFNLSTPF